MSFNIFTRTNASAHAAFAASVIVSQVSLSQAIELPYESVFKDYQSHKEVKLKNWKAANEEVRAAGGWRAYQREAQAPDVPATASSAPVPTKTEPTTSEKPATNAHQGHSQ
jgi:hypothetical protein